MEGYIKGKSYKQGVPVFTFRVKKKGGPVFTFLSCMVFSHGLDFRSNLWYYRSVTFILYLVVIYFLSMLSSHK